MIYDLENNIPKLDPKCWVASNAIIIGKVELKKDSNIWFNAVLRGDVHEIRIGDDSNIQDGAVIHGTYQQSGTIIGNKVSIAHNAVVHGCTIHDNVLIGMGAIVMDKAVIHSGAVIAAGAVVLAGTIVEANSIYAGAPAKKIKATGPEMLAVIERTAANYPKYAGWFKDAEGK